MAGAAGAAGDIGGEFDSSKYYLVSGENLNSILREIAQNRPSIAEEGGIQIEEIGVETGTRLSLIAPPATGTYVLGAEGGVVTWLATTSCP